MLSSEWFTKYSINNNTIYQNYINKLSNKSEEKNVETKIDQIEKEYNDKIKELEQLFNNSDNLNKLKKNNSLVILQKELDIIKLLARYTLQNKNLDYNFFIFCLNILLDLSETLKQRLGQKEIVHEKIYDNDNKEDFLISRCSYKFCSYKDNCAYNYNLKTKNLCYQDHYVHNMVSADLNILIEYIKNKYNKNSLVLHNKEILKTINTLSFVISHMESELKSKCLYLPETEWESCHILKNK